MASNEIMNNTTVLDHHDHHHRNESDDHDALSFCDLMMDNDENDPPTSEEYDDEYDQEEEDHDDLFEFLTSPETNHNRTDKIIFCGKTIMPRKQPINNNITGDTRCPRKGLFVRRESFKKYCDSSRPSDVASSPAGSGQSRSSPSLFGGPKAAPPAEAGGYYRSSSGGSRKQKVFIGLVMKLEPKMELSEIRKRQGRRGPAPMFPATGSAGGREGRSSGSCRHHHHHNWGLLLRPLWCRAHFVSAFTKASFGCISH